jgi:hypothetical protein
VWLIAYGVGSMPRRSLERWPPLPSPPVVEIQNALLAPDDQLDSVAVDRLLRKGSRLAGCRAPSLADAVVGQATVVVADADAVFAVNVSV